MNRKNIGQTFQQIRESRGLSQDYIAEGIVSRTSISKIENGKQIPTILNAQSLIQRLGLELNEFFYIQNNYKYDLKMTILHKFMNLSETTQTVSISNVIRECMDYLSLKFDMEVYNVLLVLQSLKDYENGEKTEVIKERLVNVWDHLSKIEDWIIFDLFLINNILYFFPIETAYNMASQALKTLEQKYPHLIRLKNAFILNISYLLMQANYIDKAQDYLEQSIKISKIIQRYDLLLLAKIRLSIIEVDVRKIHEYCDLLASIGADYLAAGAKKEVDHFLSN